jgi:hypothetical protein
MTNRTTKKATKRTTGTKAHGKRNAGRTAKAEAFKVPRTAKQLAAGIQARLKRSPGYWTELREAMDAGPGRVAQVMPRENGAAGATH